MFYKVSDFSFVRNGIICNCFVHSLSMDILLWVHSFDEQGIQIQILLQTIFKALVHMPTNQDAFSVF